MFKNRKNILCFFSFCGIMYNVLLYIFQLKGTPGKMKYLVLIPDGMADEKIPSLNNKTPMESAHKPNMDKLSAKSVVGLVSNVPNGMVPESDTANMAILSFDPKVYSKGRSPLEAVSMGLTMHEDEVINDKSYAKILFLIDAKACATTDTCSVCSITFSSTIECISAQRLMCFILFK